MTNKEYIKAYEECIFSICDLMRKSPEHGNAVMDILGSSRYSNVLSIEMCLKSELNNRQSKGKTE